MAPENTRSNGSARNIPTNELLESEKRLQIELERHFNDVLIFEDVALQQRARDILPYEQLKKNALENERHFQNENEKISEEKSGVVTKNRSKPFNLKDWLLIELLQWFKNFFSWFDQGFCETCSRDMEFLGNVDPDIVERAHGGHRVEKFQCENCLQTIRFARYFHPGKLLETRKGRCMEWASCFTLICRSLGYDSRYVWDQTDHVWTEVWSESQNRWLHADSCENKLDHPLMYDIGWGKKLSYIFAFSKDEIVDCVWRYSSRHAAVCKRRIRCREDILAQFLITKCKERQKSLPEARKKLLERRLVQEISEFFTQPKAGEEEGRISGSLTWRQSRGETKETNFKPYIFVLNEKEYREKEMNILYSPSKDLYVRKNCEDRISGWKNGVFKAENIFRKEEKDWKMVYLARNEGTKNGEIKWRFDWTDRSLKLSSVLVVFQHSTFEDGKVSWSVSFGEKVVQGNSIGALELKREDVEQDCTWIELTAILLEGKGDVAWQHAQLFRKKMDADVFPFSVKIKFDS